MQNLNVQLYTFIEKSVNSKVQYHSLYVNMY